MQLQLAFLSIMPVLVFALIDRFGSQRSALIGAVATALVELGINWLRLGFLDAFSLSSFVLLLAAGSLSIEKHDLIYFKFQSVALEFGVAIAFLIYGWAFDIRLFEVIVRDHMGLLELVESFERDYYSLYIRTMSTSIPYLLLAHAAVTAFAALRCSTLVWVGVRVVGLYGMIALLFVAERMLQVSY